MHRFRYFILSAVLLAADQISKALVVRFIPPYSVAWSFGRDFFRLIHVRNTGVAFSMGSGVSEAARIGLFIIVPLLVLAAVGVYLTAARELTTGQRWTLAAVLGGGLGNQIDRIFRPEGVVDFLDFKFYGLFGLERWPTFNVADASLVVSSLVLVILLIRQEAAARRS